MGSLDHIQVVRNNTFNRIVITRLDVDTADGKTVRIDTIDDTRTHVQSHMAFERYPYVFHADVVVVDNLRMDTIIDCPDSCQMQRVHYAGAEYVGVTEDQTVRLLVRLTCRTRQDIRSVIVP